MLEDFIKDSMFNGKEKIIKQNLKKSSSFIQMQEKSENKATSTAGPVLKAMLFGFPAPRNYLFSSQSSKGESLYYIRNNIFLYVLSTFSIYIDI